MVRTMNTPALGIAGMGLAGFLLVDTTVGAPSPFGELGEIAKMGLAGIILVIWWIERKERTERQAKDDARYEVLQGKLIEALMTHGKCEYFKIGEGHVSPPGHKASR